MLYELLSQVNRYLDNEITLEQLEDWLAPRSPALLLSPDSDVGELVGTVELGLAEMSIGALLEEEFRALLREAVPGNLPAEYRQKETVRYTMSSSDLVVELSFSGAAVVTSVQPQ